MGKRFPAIRAKYSGSPRLVGPWPKFKKGDVVFVCHMSDLFAMPSEIVAEVLAHCRKWPLAEYVFQTKVPQNIRLYNWCDFMPPRRVIGTTIESDNETGWEFRGNAIRRLGNAGERTFVTVEPIMEFTEDFADILVSIGPSFVNVGSDSKHNRLPEPTGTEVLGLIADLRAAGVEVRVKPNLARLAGKGAV
jgi:protein gp37